MATITITTTTAQDARIVAAFGERLGLGRDATGPEVKAELVELIKAIVKQYEERQAAQSAVSGVTDLGDVT